MNERLLRLTVGTAIDDADAIVKDADNGLAFIEGYVWGVLSHALGGVHHDMVVAGVDDRIMVCIQWSVDDEFISYPFSIDPGVRKAG